MVSIPGQGTKVLETNSHKRKQLTFYQTAQGNTIFVNNAEQL